MGNRGSFDDHGDSSHRVYVAGNSCWANASGHSAESITIKMIVTKSELASQKLSFKSPPVASHLPIQLLPSSDLPAGPRLSRGLCLEAPGRLPWSGRWFLCCREGLSL